MTRIICRAMNCLFWERGICSSEEIEYDPELGCVTFEDIGDFGLHEEDIEAEDWEMEEEELYEEIEDEWDEEEEGEDEDL
ncbi:MAG: hypothetical protein ACUVWZ_06285 [Anaerolineae bacterium]